jgi:hypothetical protein
MGIRRDDGGAQRGWENRETPITRAAPVRNDGKAHGHAELAAELRCKPHVLVPESDAARYIGPIGAGSVTSAAVG